MKATLEFNLPDDEANFDVACKAGRTSAALEEFREFLRSTIKYGNISEVESKIYLEIQKEFYETFEGLLPE